LPSWTVDVVRLNSIGVFTTDSGEQKLSPLGYTEPQSELPTESSGKPANAAADELLVTLPLEDDEERSRFEGKIGRAVRLITPANNKASAIAKDACFRFIRGRLGKKAPKLYSFSEAKFH
jgi:hypothetical protein